MEPSRCTDACMIHKTCVFATAHKVPNVCPIVDGPFIEVQVVSNTVAMECEMGTCPINFDRENTECAQCRHFKPLSSFIGGV